MIDRALYYDAICVKIHAIDGKRYEIVATAKAVLKPSLNLAWLRLGFISDGWIREEAREDKQRYGGAIWASFKSSLRHLRSISLLCVGRPRSTAPTRR